MTTKKAKATLRQALAEKHRRYGSTMQRGQMVRYLEHCRGLSNVDAWATVDAMSRNTLLSMYRLLALCIRERLIVWKDGRFVESR